jgi:hypothetical protein
MSNTACVVYEAETAYLREYLDSPPVFARVRVVHLFCVVFFALFVFVLHLVYPMLPVSLDCLFVMAPSVCLRPASCVPNVPSVSRWSVRDCSVGFL